MLCNFQIIHYYIYNNFCNEFTYHKNFVNKKAVTEKFGTPPAGAQYFMGSSDKANGAFKRIRWWRQCAPHLIHGSFGPRESAAC